HPGLAGRVQLREAVVHEVPERLGQRPHALLPGQRQARRGPEHGTERLAAERRRDVPVLDARGSRAGAGSGEFGVRTARPSGARAGTAPAGRADEPGGESRRVRAVPVQGPITIDGVPSEPVWETDNVFDGFTEREPVEGSVPSMRTEVRVAYDDAAIYVAAWLYDPSPDSIVARLARRDASISADRFAVYLDPYHDRRSGYYFMVNAAGTQYDGTLS